MDTTKTTLKIPKKLSLIIQKLADTQLQAIIVGGFVRDALLGIKSKDIDIEVFGIKHPKQLFLQLRDFGSAKIIGKNFGIIQLIDGPYTYEFALPRIETKTGLKHQNFDITFVPHSSFKEAARRRDFTINSMGYDPITHTLLDPFKGLRDLKAKRLMYTSHAFSEDPLRVLRALQFSARFKLRISTKTKTLCQSLSLEHLSAERIEIEFDKLLLVAKSPSKGLQYFFDLGLEAYFFKTSPLTKRTWMKQILLIDQLKKELNNFEPQHQKTILLTGLFWVANQSLKHPIAFNSKKGLQQHPAYTCIQLLCKKKKTLHHVQQVLFGLSSILDHKTLSLYDTAGIVLALQEKDMYENTLFFIKALAVHQKSTKLELFLNQASMLQIKKRYRVTGDDLIKQGLKAGPKLKLTLRDAHINEMIEKINQKE